MNLPLNEEGASAYPRNCLPRGLMDDIRWRGQLWIEYPGKKGNLEERNPVSSIPSVPTGVVRRAFAAQADLVGRVRSDCVPPK